MAITDEQPPEDTEPRLKEYLTRMFRDARYEDTTKNQVDRYTNLPEQVSIGKTYFFLNAIAAHPVITAEGFYGYKSTGWVLLG